MAVRCEVPLLHKKHVQLRKWIVHQSPDKISHLPSSAARFGSPVASVQSTVFASEASSCSG